METARALAELNTATVAGYHPTPPETSTPGLAAVTALNAAGIGSTGMVDASIVGGILYEVLAEGRTL